MKRFAATTMLAGSILAGLLGAAGTAQANIGDATYNQQQYGPVFGPRVYVPHVDTTVRADTNIVRH